ncbi:hypothetical protein DFH08DRAFT_948099 [Mycena albidolilacea]|uniref:Uncharacterized protein n=1 Tax=Mycena albidolilacea TaxID=1033008 RepID=A0AAD7F2S7_9AGAR|nr:hypothetical protein DFH08DRAFT_948099 [Mycena albidolilacea]
MNMQTTSPQSEIEAGFAEEAELYEAEARNRLIETSVPSEDGHGDGDGDALSVSITAFLRAVSFFLEIDLQIGITSTTTSGLLLLKFDSILDRPSPRVDRILDESGRVDVDPCTSNARSETRAHSAFPQADFTEDSTSSGSREAARNRGPHRRARPGSDLRYEDKDALVHSGIINRFLSAAFDKSNPLVDSPTVVFITAHRGILGGFFHALGRPRYALPTREVDQMRPSIKISSSRFPFARDALLAPLVAPLHVGARTIEDALQGPSGERGWLNIASCLLLAALARIRTVHHGKAWQN